MYFTYLYKNVLCKKYNTMNTKEPTLNNWQKCLGLCMICGQPMGMKSKNRGTILSIKDVSKENDIDIDLNTLSLEDNEFTKPNVEEDAIESMLLVEECPIKMTFLRFNMLGEQQECHIIDQYTFLEKKNKEDCFEALMKKYEKDFIAFDTKNLFNAFFDQILREKNKKDYKLEQAISTCKRLGDKYTFVGCKRCNLCMNKPNFHVDTILRCFTLTENCDYPFLESRQYKPIKVKKLIQQIAFFFKFEEDIQKWDVKSDNDILLDVNVWRCVSNLCYWGMSSKNRYRLIAIFHTSHYLYCKSTLKEIIRFEYWHIYFFRDLYMKTFKVNTFYGMKNIEAALIFDLSQKRGKDWIFSILNKVHAFEIELTEYYNMQTMSKIEVVNERLKQSVHDEKSLLRFMCGKEGIEEGSERLLSFFKYNMCSGKENKKIKSACEVFQNNLCVSFRKAK